MNPNKKSIEELFGGELDDARDIPECDPAAGS